MVRVACRLHLILKFVAYCSHQLGDQLQELGSTCVTDAASNGRNVPTQNIFTAPSAPRSAPATVTLASKRSGKDIFVSVTTDQPPRGAPEVQDISWSTPWKLSTILRRELFKVSSDRSRYSGAEVSVESADETKFTIVLDTFPKTSSGTRTYPMQLSNKA